ncbi:hypothetical protein EVAR_62926_1 [Eumeta japonica]|uniref:Mos1 transposase HTH domain-containing protein n=1 Tax=Eumeta variegata TaxID=151549 RepID=A0A4C1ZU18_EUMVA|nr:hypothetical protein EVAR_62926_1 [Eumeta japonica]
MREKERSSYVARTCFEFKVKFFKLNECNLIAQQSLARFETVLDDEVTRKTTIYDWFAKFKLARVDRNDECRDGRPSTAVNNKHIDAVRPMMETDRHLTYH